MPYDIRIEKCYCGHPRHRHPEVPMVLLPWGWENNFGIEYDPRDIIVTQCKHCACAEFKREGTF